MRRFLSVKAAMFVTAAAALAAAGIWLVFNEIVRSPAVTAAEEPPEGFVVWSSNRSGGQDIFRMDLPGKEITRLTEHPHAEYYARISPDGSRIAFARYRDPGKLTHNQYDWNVIMLNLETGEETFIHEFGHAPTWSTDGRYIYFQYKVMQVGRYDLETGEVDIVLPRGHGEVAHGTALSTPHMGPDGERMAVTMRFDQHMTAVVDDQGRIKPVSNGCQIAWSPDGDYLYFVKPTGRMGNSVYIYEFGTPKPREWFDMPGEFSHEYFPKLSNDGRWLVFGASRSENEHLHQHADFENFLWQVGTPIENAMRLTFNKASDNYPDIHVY